MFKNEYLLTVDLKKKMSDIVPTFVQYDNATLLFKIFDNGKSYDLTDFTSAEVSHKRPDGVTVIGTGVIEQDAKGNSLIRYSYLGNEMNKTGFVSTSLSLFSTDKKVSIQPFRVNIVSDLRDGLIDSSTEEVGMLQDLIVEVNAAVDAANQAVIDAESAVVNANQAVITAQEAADSVDAVILSSQQATTEAQTATANAITATNDTLLAKTATETATANADASALNADTKASLAQDKINEANQVIIDTNTAKNETIQATADANEIVLDGLEMIDASTHKGDYNSATQYYRGNEVRINGSSFVALQDTLGNPPPASPDVSNLFWELRAQRGIDGTGAVSSVNTVSPDVNGDVTLTANDVGASPTGHGHAINDVTGLQTALDDKSPTSHTHTELHTHSNKTVLDGLTDNAGQLLYNDVPVGAVTTVNGQTGDITGLETETGSQTKATQALTDANTYTDSALVAGEATPISFVRGVQTVNVPIDSTLKVVEVEGKTVVNHIPLFDSGLWVFNGVGTVTVNSPSKITLVATGTGQGSPIDIPCKPNTQYFFNGISNGEFHIYTNNGTTFSEQITTFPFTTPSDAKTIRVNATNALLGAGTFTFENVTLNEGTTTQEFVANVKGVTNPTIEVKGNNLLPGFRDWNFRTGAGGTSLLNSLYSATITKGTANSYFSIEINVKKNQDYTISVDHNRKIGVYEIDGSTPIVAYTTAQTVSFNSGDNEKIGVYVNDIDGVQGQSYTFTNPMLNLGSVALPFEVANPSTLTLKTTLHTGDKVYVDANGQARVTRSKREILLDGSLAWSYVTTSTGHKTVKYALTGYVSDKGILAKYNGKMLPVIAGGSSLVSDSFALSSALYISIPNTDSGWGETYTPTADEIKAYFLGWTMGGSITGAVPYVNEATSGAKNWWKIYSGVGTQISGSNAISGTGVTTLPTVMNDQGYNPYRLLYDLATPIDEPIQAIGSLKLVKGDNQIEVTEGRIVREVTNPKIGSSKVYCYINSEGLGSLTRFKVSTYIKVFRNGEEDSYWTFLPQATTGVLEARIDLPNFDSSAIYTLDYIPQEMYKVSAHATPISAEYHETLGGVASDLVDSVTDLEYRQGVQGDLIDNVIEKFSSDIIGLTESIASSGGSGEMVLIAEVNFAVTPSLSAEFTGLSGYKFLELRGLEISTVSNTSTTLQYNDVITNSYRFSIASGSTFLSHGSNTFVQIAGSTNIRSFIAEIRANAIGFPMISNGGGANGGFMANGMLNNGQSVLNSMKVTSSASMNSGKLQLWGISK